MRTPNKARSEKDGKGRVIFFFFLSFFGCHSLPNSIHSSHSLLGMLLQSSLLALLLAAQSSFGWQNWSPRLNYRNTRGPGGSLQLLLQTLNITDTDNGGKSTPCCMDTLGSGVCKTMSRRATDRFIHQCRSNADFSFIQCCASCHFGNDVLLRGIDGREFPSPEALYDYDVERMLQSKGAQCVDRRTARFCEALVTQKLVDKSNSHVLNIYKRMPSGYKDLKSLIGGIDLLRDAPCESSALAFRVCRKTCGYCSKDRARAIVKFNAEVARNPALCQTLY